MPDRKTKKTRSNGAVIRADPGAETGAYFLSLEVENVRCFAARQILNLSDAKGRPARWTILLGENGTGKTTILQLLAVFHWLDSLRSEATVRSGSGEVVRDVINGYLLAQNLVRGDTVAGPSWKVRTVYELGTIDETPIFHAQSFIKITSPGTVEFLRPNAAGALPACHTYGLDRRLEDPAFHRDSVGDLTRTFFLGGGDILGAEEWLLRLDYSASKRSAVRLRQRRRLEMVRKLLIEILPDVSGIRFDPSSGVVPTPSVQFETPYGWVPLRQLGYGYRSIIGWIVHLAARMIERYVDSDEPLKKPAVVLVDEIDLHLHPRWQRQVIGFLTEHFPNTQFIATAHSPLIVQAAAGANIAVLRREGDHVVIDNHPETIQGWRVDQVLTSDLFGLETARPPEMEKLLLERKRILEKPKLSKADRKQLEEINDRLGPIPPGDSFQEAKKTTDLIERSLQLIKKYQGTKT